MTDWWLRFLSAPHRQGFTVDLPWHLHIAANDQGNFLLHGGLND